MEEEKPTSLAALSLALDLVFKGTKKCARKCDVLSKGGAEISDSQKECLGIVSSLCQ